MELKLNKLQREFLEVIKEKGYITLSDASRFWTSYEYQKANIQRFINVGILKETDVIGRFDYIITE